MTTLTDDAKAIIAVTTRLGDRQRPSLSPSMWHRVARQLADAGHSPADLFGGIDLQTVESERLAELIQSAPAALLEAETLAQRGVWITTIGDDHYPARFRRQLGHHAPPVLFGAGSVDLLGQIGIGIVGSRNVDPAGAEVAQAVAAEAVRLGCTVVSGAARGVDQLAMNAAYEVSGSVVGFLADSLLSRIRSADVLEALDGGTTCLVTSQHPAAGFSPGSAMGRNKLIYGLADLTIVIASDRKSGGTWAGATEAHKNQFGPVAVWRGQGEGPGNADLEGLGISALSDVSALESLLMRTATNVVAPSQLSLLE